MQKTVNIYILLALTYETLAWKSKKTLTNCKRQTMNNGINKNKKKLDKTQNATLNAILPVSNSCT